MHRTVKIVLLAWVSGLVASPPSAADEIDLEGLGFDFRDYSRGAIDFFNETARDPLPHLSSEQFDKIEDGKVVVIQRKEGRRDKPEDLHYRVIGFMLVEAPQLDVWIAGLHPEYADDDSYVYAIYSQDGKGKTVAYLYVNLPWPVTDRHTVMASWKGIDVYERSDTLIWEESWDLVDESDRDRIARELLAADEVPGIDTEKYEAAVFLPVNYGSFVLIKVDERLTLMAYHLTTAIGGIIPESLVASFAAAELDDALSEIAERSQWVLGVYDADPQVYGPDGIPVAKTAP